MPEQPAYTKDDKDKKRATDTESLRTDIRYSFKSLLPFREHRRQAIKAYLGSYFSDENQMKREIVPIGLLNLAVDIWTFKMAASNPRALVTTRKREFKPDAVTLGLAVDRDVERMEAGITLRRLAKDGIFSFGIACTHRVATDTVKIEDEVYRVGDAVVARVDLDDFVCDMNARRFEDCYYIGHKIRVPLDWAQKNTAFNEPERSKLTVSDNYKRNPMDGGDRVESFSKNMQDAGREHLVPQVDLWVLYLSRTREIVMMSAEGKGGELSRKPWRGPKSSTGPYRFLRFEEVPDNIMPLPPIAMLQDLAKVANDLLFKVTEQARRQKTQLVATRQSAVDAEKIRVGKDGGITLVDHTIDGNVAEFKTGGVDPSTMAVFLSIRDLFSWSAGNLESQAGLGPQSETASQDKLMAQSANERIRAMTEKMEHFTQQILGDIAWYRWNDPLGEVAVTKRVPGTSMEIPAVFSKDTRQGELSDYDFQIVPYSMQRLTPSERATRLMTLFTQIIMPISQASGGTVRPKAAEFIQKMGKYLGIPDDTDDVVDTGMEPVTLPGGDGPGKPAVTERKYTRTNRSGGTTAGKDRVLLEAAIGGNPQASERAMAAGGG